MIQFLGLHLGTAAATVTVLGRDLHLWGRSAAAMVNVVEDAGSGVAEVPPGEWVRAGSYALQEAYFQLPVNARKAWGLGLAGPSGWIALDYDYQPISPLRITGSAPLEEDLMKWIESNPRAQKRVSVLLSPKDYFRFVLSGGLAADVTTASRLGLLVTGHAQWSEVEIEKRGIPLSWLPPVFDSQVTTGRLSEEGMRRTSLPGGFWLVAGAHEREAELLARGDLSDGNLQVRFQPGGAALLAYGVSGRGPVRVPEGWRLIHSPVAGNQILEREVTGLGESPTLESASSALVKHQSELEGLGFEVSGRVQVTGGADLGAASLAAMGSGLVKGWDYYYRHRAPS